MTLLYKKGDKGQEVKRTQRALGNIMVDGDFGPQTERAVQDYQKWHSLSVDGVVGPATRIIIVALMLVDGMEMYHGEMSIKQKYNLFGLRFLKGVIITIKKLNTTLKAVEQMVYQ